MVILKVSAKIDVNPDCHAYQAIQEQYFTDHELDKAKLIGAELAQYFKQRGLNQYAVDVQQIHAFSYPCTFEPVFGED